MQRNASCPSFIAFHVVCISIFGYSFISIGLWASFLHVYVGTNCNVPQQILIKKKRNNQLYRFYLWWILLLVFLFVLV